MVPSDAMIDLAQERDTLLEIHARDRQAHFQTDAAMLAEHQGENFICVGNGDITNENNCETRSTRNGFPVYPKTSVL